MKRFFTKKSNLPVVIPDQTLAATDANVVAEEIQALTKNGKSNIFIGKLNIIVHPVKRHLKHRWHNYYHPRNRHWHLHLFADGLIWSFVFGTLFSILIGWAIWGWVAEHGLLVKIYSDQSIYGSGETGTYQIKYKNNGKLGLADARIALDLPAGFTLIDAEPKDTFDAEKKTFTIGDIPSGVSGMITIRGAMMGSVGSHYQIAGRMIFSHDNISERDKEAHDEYVIDSPTISANIQLPGSTAVNDTLTGTINYVSKSDVIIPQLSFTLDGQGVLIVSSSSIPLRNNVWTMTDIQPHATGTITFIATTAADRQKTNLETTVRPLITISGAQVAEETITAQTELVHSNLNLELKSASQTIVPGKSASYTLTYNNAEGADLRNLTMTVEHLVDGRVISQRTITPDAKLLNAKKDDQGTINLTVPLDNLAGKITNTANPNIATRLAVRYNLTGDDTRPRLALSNTVEQRITTDFSVQAFGRYFTPEGDQLGIGPLPPIAGAKNHYWIFWSVGTSVNDVHDVLMSARLPANVKFTGKTSATTPADVQYDRSSQTITWRVAKVNAPTNNTNLIATAFEVELVPTATQVGSPAILVTSITASAVDSITNYQFNLTAPAITTHLTRDALETSGGVVQAQ